MEDRNPGESFDQEAQVRGLEAHDGAYHGDDTDHSRWWFLSSAFPMAAGTLGPVASAFSICTIAEPWRQRLLPGADIQNAPFVANPAWYATMETL